MAVGVGVGLLDAPGAPVDRRPVGDVDVVDRQGQVVDAVAVLPDVGRDGGVGGEGGRHHEPDAALLEDVRRPVGPARLRTGVGGDPEPEGGREEAGHGPGVSHPQLDGVPSEEQGPGGDGGGGGRGVGEGHACSRMAFGDEDVAGVVVEGGEEGGQGVDQVGHRAGGEEDGLEAGDVVGDAGHLGHVEGTDVGAAEGGRLPARGEDPGAVGLGLAALLDQPELHREPEHPRQQPQPLVRLGAGHRLAHQPVDGGQLGDGQLVGVPDHLVDDVGLGCVQRLGRVPQVLGGVEDGAGEGAVEVPQRGQAGDRVVAECRLPFGGDRFEEAADLGELGDVVGRQAQLLLGLEERPAGVGVVEGLELAGDDPPHLVLGDGVVGPGDGVARLPVEGEGGQVVAPPAVVGVAEARVIGAEDDLDLSLPVPYDGCVQRPGGHLTSVGSRRGFV